MLKDKVSVAGNGMQLDGKLLFVGEDPQIYLPLNGIEQLSEVVINMEVKYTIELEEIQRMNGIIRHGEKISKLLFFKN